MKLWVVCLFAEDFVAHSATVNCLALGHKSGRVMVTGGDDKKVIELCGLYKAKSGLL